MKILRVMFTNIGIFEEGLTIEFSAKDKVIDKAQVDEIKKSIYTQNVLGIVGINASGKTTTLKLIKFAMDILFGKKGLDQLPQVKGIVKENTEMTIDFFLDDKFYRLKSNFKNTNFEQDQQGLPLKFGKEKLYQKNKSEVTSKKNLYDYNEGHLLFTRNEVEKQEFSTLKKQESIILSIVKDTDVFFTDMLKTTMINTYNVKGNAQMEFINLFDEGIESLNNKEESLEVSFKCNKETKCLDSLYGNQVLSSGTIKGGNLMYKLQKVLKTGGYLLIDEIEIHMHKELVLTIIDLFNDNDVNKNNATLVFTTHYAEILDRIERKDNIYITRKNKNHRCEILRYSSEVKRNDIKKSEVFLSNYIKGTAPSYESIQNVRRFLCNN